MKYIMFFSKKLDETKFKNFQSKIKDSFEKIKYEVSLSYKWIENLNLRLNKIEEKTTDPQLKILNQRNIKLKIENNELKEINSNLYEKMNEVILYLNKIDPKIRKINEIEKKIESRFDDFETKHYNNINSRDNSLELERIKVKRMILELEKKVNDNNNNDNMSESFEKIYKILEQQNQKILRLVDLEIENKKELDKNNNLLKKTNAKNNIENATNMINEDQSREYIKSEDKLNLFDVKLSKSERKILYVLFNSNKQMSYSEISKNSDLNYGTIKNSMYTLRKKNIEIPYDLNDKKEKLYYLSKELILKITGK